MKLLLTRLVRNKTGQVSRTDQTITADTIVFGRGSDCKLHLPDPRVALHHASICIGAAGGVVVEAMDGALTINGNPETSAKLKLAQRIKLGPYAIEVLEPPPEIDAAVTLELVDPLVEDTGGGQERVRVAKSGLTSTWLSRRRLSWIGFAVIIVAFLAWPILHALKVDPPTPGAAPVLQPLAKVMPDESWNPGPFDSAHASFGRDCAKCHQTPFKQVQNDACEACHKSVGWHFARDTEAKRQLHRDVFGAGKAMGEGNDADEGRCAACHRDHKGPAALKRQDSPLCTDCHRDLKTKHPAAGTVNVTNFQTDHPPFKLSMVVPPAVRDASTSAQAPKKVSISQDDAKALVERSNLKFPHQTHLTGKGVRSPDGKQILTCRNCHTPDETGTRFKAVTMREHCQSCHSLEFEPASSARQAPHGSVNDVIASVNEFYAQAALLNRPIDQAHSKLERPGAGSETPAGTRSVAWVNKKAQQIVTEMMEKRTCFTCHEINRAGDSWKIAPIAVTEQWLTKSRFPHIKHNTFTCSKCHDVEQSDSSKDIAIPDIKNCRSCHAGNTPEVDKAPGSCETCHSFHVGGSRSTHPALFTKLPPNHPKPMTVNPMTVKP